MCMPDLTHSNALADSDLFEQTSRAVDHSSCEELRTIFELDEVDVARLRILQRFARGLPTNVLERRLIAGELPPGFLIYLASIQRCCLQ